MSGGHGGTVDSNWRIALRAVAWFVIILSAGSLLLSVVASFFFDAFLLNFADILNLFAGFGLLRSSRGWRLFLLIYLWCMFLGNGTALLFWSQVKFNSPQLAEYKGIVFFYLWGIEFLYGICLLILHQPKVRRMFSASYESEPR